MKFLFFLFTLYIPDLTKIERLELLESKIEKMIESGKADSAKTLSIYLKSKTRNRQKEKKSLYYLYEVAKIEGELAELDEIFLNLLKMCNKAESLALLRDFSIYYYNRCSYTKVLEIKDRLPIEDDTINFLVALSYFNLGDFKNSFRYAEASNLNETKPLKAVLLYKLGSIEEAMKIANEIEFPEIELLSQYSLSQWDNFIETYKKSHERIKPEFRLYADLLYLISLREAGLKTPLTLFEQWIELYGEQPLVNYVMYLYSIELYERKDYNRALKNLKAIDTLYLFSIFSETKVDYHWLLGKIQFQRNASLSEIRKYVLAVLKSTNSQEIKDSANYLLGVTLFRFNQLRRSLEYFSQIPPNSDLYWSSQYYVAKVNLKLGNYREAEKIVEYVQNQTNLDRETQIKFIEIKGELYENEGKFNQAIKAYQSLLNLINKNANPTKYYETLLKIDVLKFKRGDYRSLEEAYLSYAKKYPESPLNAQLYYDIMFKYVYLRDPNNAKRFLESLIQSFPQSPRTKDALELYFSSQIATLEDTALLNALSLKNSSLTSDLQYFKGILYLREKMTDQALRSFNEVKEGRYKDEAKYKIMEIYASLNKFQEVEIVGQDLLPEELKGPTDLKIIQLYLRALKMQGKSDAFESFLNYYITKDSPYNKDLAIFISDLYFREHDTVNAVKYILKSKALGATDTEISKYNPDLLKLTGWR